MAITHSETCCICYDSIIINNNIKKVEESSKCEVNIEKEIKELKESNKPIFCNHCIEGVVCQNCYESLIENDIDDKCPICKRTDWNPVIIEMNIIEQAIIDGDDDENDNLMIFTCECKYDTIHACVLSTLIHILKITAIFIAYLFIFFIAGLLVSLFNIFESPNTISIFGFIGIVILRGFICLSVLIILGLCCCCCSDEPPENNTTANFYNSNLAGLVIYWFVKVAHFFYS